jgi:hypothetical protein
MRIFIVLMMLILTVSCSDDKNVDTNVCTTTGSIDNVSWIAGLKKTMTNCSCEISIIKGTYEGQTVIFIALTDPLCDGIDTPTLYNCEGKEMRSFTDSAADQKELFDKVTRDSVLYRCKS